MHEYVRDDLYNRYGVEDSYVLYLGASEIKEISNKNQKKI